MRKLSIVFRVVKTRPNSKGDCPIFIRLTMAGHRVEFSTGQYTKPEFWCKQSERLLNKRDEVAKATNKLLEISRVRLLEAKSELDLIGKPYTVADIRDKFLGRETKPTSILKALDVFIEHCQELHDQGNLSIGRMKRYQVFKGKLVAYLKQKHNGEDIAITKLSLSFIAQFRDFLSINHRLDIGTIAVYLKILNRLMNFGVEREWIKTNPFASFKIGSKTTDRVKLELHEVKLMENAVFTTERLTQVRDIFLFCIYTGLSHSDVEKLTTANLIIGSDGKKWVSVHRTKTDVPCKIPLLPQAEELLNKYQGHPECSAKGKLLPVRSNQKTNEYLHEIAVLCGINKDITFHCARHTFATTICSNNGISLEVIGKLLGHRSLRSTQIYAKMSEQRIVEEFSNIKV